MRGRVGAPGDRMGALLRLLAALALVGCGEGRRHGGPPEGAEGGEAPRAAAAPATPAPDTAGTAPEAAPLPTDVVPEAPLEETEWLLVSLPGAPDPPPGARATLVLERDGGLLRGSTGCNTFGGSWEIAGTRLTLGLEEVGGRACGPELARLEIDYLEALRRAGSFRLRGDTLALLGADGVVARFEAP